MSKRRRITFNGQSYDQGDKGITIIRRGSDSLQLVYSVGPSPCIVAPITPSKTIRTVPFLSTSCLFFVRRSSPARCYTFEPFGFHLSASHPTSNNTDERDQSNKPSTPSRPTYICTFQVLIFTHKHSMNTTTKQNRSKQRTRHKHSMNTTTKQNRSKQCTRVVRLISCLSPYSGKTSSRNLQLNPLYVVVQECHHTTMLSAMTTTVPISATVTRMELFVPIPRLALRLRNQMLWHIFRI